jgi:hypothetical protein
LTVSTGLKFSQRHYKNEKSQKQKHLTIPKKSEKFKFVQEGRPSGLVPDKNPFLIFSFLLKFKA